MTTTGRSFNIGEQIINGYTVTIERVISAHESDDNSRVRIAAKYFGTIITPDGEEIELGATGKTSPQIKRIIGLAAIAKTGGDKQLNSLKTAKKALEAAGLNTDEIEQKIAEREAEIEVLAAERQRISEAERESKKAIKQQIAKLEKAAKAMMAAGLDCEDITNKIAELNSQI